MHPRIRELLAYVDSQTDILREAYESVPTDRRSLRPSPDRWSPAEVVHHLALVERRLTQRLGALIEQARALPPETDTTSVLSPASTTAAVDRTERFVTFEAGEPRDTNAARVWDDFLEARQALMQVVVTGDGLALGGVSTPHPRLGVFTGYDWIAFIGSHAARHAAQIREANAALIAQGGSLGP